MADAVQPTQTTINQTSIPDYAKPYVQNLLGQAQYQTDTNQNPYMQYMGDRVAGFTPLQKQSYENAAMMQTAPQLQDATAMAGLAGMGALNTGFAYNPYSASQVNAGQLSNYQMGAPSAVNTQSFTDPGMAQSFMNPYQDAVTEVGVRKAGEQANQATLQRNAQATQGGAFGGSRQAIGNAAAASGLATQIGDLRAQGNNAAYLSGMGQFNAQQGANLQAQQANQQAGLTAGGQNLAAMLGVQQLGSGQSMQAQLANQQAQQSAANLNAQQGQYGAGLGLQGLQTAITGANALGTLGQTQYGQNMGINQMQNQLGAQQQQQVQQGLTNQYGDFLNYQNQPYKNMGFMSDILRGLPLTQQASTMYQAPPSAMSTVAGLAATGIGAYGALKAGGGSVGNTYAKGGLVRARPAGLAELALYKMA